MGVKIERDEVYEMVRISINGKVEFEGNFWDLNSDAWVDILRQHGIEVTEGDYSYDD